MLRVWITRSGVSPLGHIEVRKWEEGKNENGKSFAKSYGGVIFDPNDPNHWDIFEHHVLHEDKVAFINKQEHWEALLRG
jgi:hypothetical protein